MATSSRSTCSGSVPTGFRLLALFACAIAATSGVDESSPSSHLMRSTLLGRPDAMICVPTGLWAERHVWEGGQPQLSLMSLWCAGAEARGIPLLPLL